MAKSLRPHNCFFLSATNSYFLEYGKSFCTFSKYPHFNFNSFNFKFAVHQAILIENKQEALHYSLRAHAKTFAQIRFLTPKQCIFGSKKSYF